ncbi:MAG: hypothetical protein SFU27_01930 [Thermonemataceae bacterium]|nr:hypothetical protein [Thermonemataceae bacterium]
MLQNYTLFKKLLLTIAFIFFAYLSKGQSTTRELVLGIPECHQSVIKLGSVKDIALALEGVEVKGVCSRHDLILLKLAEGIDEQSIITELQNKFPNYHFFRKEASFSEVMQICEEELIKQR